MGTGNLHGWPEHQLVQPFRTTAQSSGRCQEPAIRLLAAHPREQARVPSRDGPIPQISGCFLLLLTRLALTCASSTSHWLRPAASGRGSRAASPAPPPHPPHQLPTGLSPLHREGLFAANSRIRLRSLFSQWSCAPGAAPGCSPAWQPSRAQRAKAQPLNWENQRPSWLEAVHRKLTLRPILRHNRPGPSQFTAKYS